MSFEESWTAVARRVQEAQREVDEWAPKVARTDGSLPSLEAIENLAAAGRLLQDACKDALDLTR